ncbi:MAG: hypothetical protein CMO74_05215 [Verrucomicrobiales bacterium]|nr:hypothetical protein [Verrucomicrobiales bacterium]|tara:strand:- start:2737 stop:2916 length:180 start_codon:yes stop_codon:yes gene_type:complete
MKMKYLRAITQRFEENEVTHSVDPEEESVRATEELSHGESTVTDAGADEQSANPGGASI